MWEYQGQRITILGMGYLMEYIYPCYESLLGDRIGENIVAVTADEADLPRKRRRCAFEVILNDCMAALEKNRPDLILVAPPPKIVPTMIDEVLVPYFSARRAEGGKLPTIYAFPPAPAGKAYQEKLGQDVLVVNILPNMVSEIAGERISGEGLTYLTFPEESIWPESEKELLSRFFSPLGKTIEVKPAQVMSMLAGTVAVHLVSDIVFAITDALGAGGSAVDYRSIAGAMRAYHRAKHGYSDGSYPCSADEGRSLSLPHVEEDDVPLVRGHPEVLISTPAWTSIPPIPFSCP